MTDRTFDDGGTAAINWIYRSYNKAKPYIQPGLDRDTRHPEWTSQLLDRLGRPDRDMYNIAVTGSKGKGSHAILMSAMLEKMGFRVGLFTGPHLINFMERFRINGEIIEEGTFIDYVNQLSEIVDDWSLPENQYFGPVGLLAVIAVKWFHGRGTDINVFELGRGALHDDVNRIAHVGAVITPVFLEHTAQLGPTFAQVGAEKAAVITDDTQWICSHPQTATVQAVLRACRQPQQAVYTLGDEVRFERILTGTRSCVVHVDSPFGSCKVLLPDAQYHLAENVAVALVAAQRAALDKRPNTKLPDTIDLNQLSLPGRLQTVAKAPEVVVDGTIHGRSAEIVRNYIHSRKSDLLTHDHGPRVGAIVGIPADKDGFGVLKTLADVLDFIIICRAHNPHLTFDDKWARMAQELYPDAHFVGYLEEALPIAMDKLESRDLLFILGTQSLVGDAMRTFRVDTQSIWRLNNVETR